MPGKVIKLEQLKALRKRWKKQGKKLVFTNGCFDLIHIGHIRYLRRAKAMGDYLVVGLNSDRSVRKIKGEKRPIMSEKERGEILASLWFVDYVVIFQEQTPERIIKSLEPDYLVKGADWGIERIVGAKEVLSWGGKVKRIKLTAGRSSSGIIERIVKRYSESKNAL